MDWSKAKNILIFILLILNIFLFVNINLANPGESIPKDVVEKAKTNLEAKGVVFKCEIPRKNVDNVTLYTEGTNLDKNRIAAALLGEDVVVADKLEDNTELTDAGKKLIFRNGNNFLFRDTAPSENLNTSDIKAIERFSRKILDKLDLPISTYHLNSNTKNPDGSIDLTFLEKYKTFLVMDNYVKLTITNKGITYLECKARKVKGLVKNENNFKNVHQILLMNFTEGSDIVITGIELGFAKEDAGELSESLVWQIKTESGITKYFLVSTGKEVSLM